MFYMHQLNKDNVLLNCDAFMKYKNNSTVHLE